MNPKALLLGLCLGFVAAAIPACGSTSTCSSSNCAGCCNAGTCVPVAQLSSTQCGANGATCVSCGSAACSTVTMTCVGSGNQGGGTANGGGSATGGGSSVGGGSSNGGGTSSGGGSSNGGGSSSGGGSANGGGSASGGGTTCTLAGQECGTGFSCMVSNISGSTFSTQCYPGVCDVVKQDCTGNMACAYAAVTQGGNPSRQCVTNGTVDRGNPCDQNNLCKKGMACLQGTGPDGGAANVCEKFCYTDTDCGNDICAAALQPIPGSGEIPLICTTRPATCDIYAQTGCMANNSCYSTQQQNVCLPTGSTTTGNTCNQINSCISGDNCIGLQAPDGGVDQRCLQTCNRDGGMPTCLAGSCRQTNLGIGVCL